MTEHENVTQANAASITERYLGMEPSEFRSEITEKWNATERVLAPIFEAVENGHYSTVEAGKAVACLVGEVFGYGEFHGGLLTMAPSELIGALRQIGTRGLPEPR